MSELRVNMTAADRSVEVLWIPPRAAGRPTLVLLHEGLGSIGLWRDFPQALAERTGLAVLAWSRYGYGKSEVLDGPRRPDYLHREAMEALPELLEAFNIEEPILVGHSDGASIAIIHAGSGLSEPRKLVLIAPQVFLRESNIAGIRGIVETFRTTDLKSRMAAYHHDPERTFFGWADVWLSPEFRDWNIEDSLPRIRAPALVIQGRGDEYSGIEQVEAIEKGMTGAPATRLILDDCRHSPHFDQREKVLSAIAEFLAA